MTDQKRPTELYAKERAAKENAMAIVEMLKRLEWCIFDHDLANYICPECHHEQDVEGHAPDCELNALLNAANPERKVG